MEYALGVPCDGESRELLERHLAGCPSCRQELEWVTADRVVDLATERSVRAPEAPTRRPRKASRVARRGVASRHRWAIAAGLAAVLGVGGWVWTHLDRTVLESAGEIAVVTESQGAAAGLEAPAGPRAGDGGAASANALLIDGFESGRLVAWSTPESEEKTEQPSRRRI